jgi:lipoprotein-releasing system permease protein
MASTTSTFELFVAQRYLRAKRKQAVISIITVVSILGVAAGVMALIVALAINNGFRATLERNLLGATAHVNILEKEPEYGIENWRELTAKLRALPGVRSAEPTLYTNVYISSPIRGDGAVLKGIQPEVEAKSGGILHQLKQGSLAGLENSSGRPGIILGSRFAAANGMTMNSIVTVMSPQGELTPYGPRPSYYSFRVVGIFESGFYELDSRWAYTSLKAAQTVFSLGDVVNAIELKVDDIDRAPEIAKEAQAVIGPKLAATSWMEQNRPLLHALRMERVVTVITIGLIQLVAALNILITLAMMVMEKYRDIAILMSMGARHAQVRKIFVLQGVLIGVVGTVLGVCVGYLLCFLADHYRLIRLDEEVYSLAYVPFQPQAWDGIWIAAAAILVSFLATLYPARNATRIAPAEALRYE